MNDIRIRIIKALIIEDQLLGLSDISRIIQESPQLTLYHMKNLVDGGIIIENRLDDREVYYSLQGYYYQEEPIMAIYSALLPLAKAIMKETKFSSEKDKFQIVMKNLVYLLEIFKEDIEELL